MKATQINCFYSADKNEQRRRPMVLNGHWKAESVKKFIARTKFSGCAIIEVKHLTDNKAVNVFDIENLDLR